MRFNAVFSWMIFLGLLCFSSEAAITIDGYTSATNNRFSNSGSFIASQFNLSGIGQRFNGQWATLISPNVVVSANHFAPGTGAVINFYSDNNPASVAVQRTVTSNNVQIGGTDLWIGVLDSNVPSTIKSYNYANNFISGTAPSGGASFVITNAGIFQGANAYMFGLAPGVEGAFQSQAVGRNLISGFAENALFLGTDNDSLMLAYDAIATPNYVPFESFLNSGDSGAPLFMESNGDLLLLGTNAFQFPGTNGVGGSGINYIGNQSAFINNFVSVNAVPEPSSVCLAGMAVFAGYVANRRRKAGRGKSKSIWVVR